MDRSQRRAFEFFLRWKSGRAAHCDRIFVGRVDLWRDTLPGMMAKHLPALEPGENYHEQFEAGQLVPAHSRKYLLEFSPDMFDRRRGPLYLEAKVGRFYPRGRIWRATGDFSSDFRPFRLLESTPERMVADVNHPLAQYDLSLEARFVAPLPANEERGGSCNAIADLVTEKGPGMQVPAPGCPTQYYDDYPFRREDSSPDQFFYAQPRMVKHLDDVAIGGVENLHARLLPSDCDILDLMSSWVSHLPNSLEGIRVTGLGMNKDELDANHALTDAVVQDLNLDPVLPFGDNQFDHAVCTVSVEYLVDPVAVLAQLARVVRTGGIVVITFSDRWFPPKVVTAWTELHPFERLGLVQDLLLRTEGYTDIHTETLRGLPRNDNDKYAAHSPWSDPLYAVWATVCV